MLVPWRVKKKTHIWNHHPVFTYLEDPGTTTQNFMRKPAVDGSACWWRENHLGCIKPVVNNLGRNYYINWWTPDFWTINSMTREIPSKIGVPFKLLVWSPPQNISHDPWATYSSSLSHYQRPKWSQDTFSPRGVLSLPDSTFLEAGDVSEGTSVSWCSWCSWFLVSVS